MKTIIVFLFVCVTASAQNHSLKNGDLLFININCGGMCDAINAVTEGYKGNDFNHMGMVVLEESKVFVYEAVGKGVSKTPLNDFLKYTKETLYVGELKTPYQYLIPDALLFCESQLGVPYDNDFLYNNGKYYCSELMYDAFKSANDNKPFFQLFPMTYKEPHTNTYFPVWIEHFEKQGTEIPEGKLGCNPGGMSLDEKIKLKKIEYQAL